MHHSKYKYSFYIIIISLLVSCEGEDGAIGPSGLNSLIQTTSEPAGSNCEFGGLKVESGLDNNKNDILDPDEVLKTSYVCSTVGKNSLVNVVDEPEGTACPNGGIKIESGIDDDRDGILDGDEIQMTRVICNGVDGEYEEQIRFSFNYSANTSSTTPEIGGELINFDKRFFIGVDSIVFSADPFVADASNNAVIELYNMTDDVVISNSLITTNQLPTSRVFLYSGNIFKELPGKEIRLGIKFSSETNGKFAASGTPYLFLYRRN